MNRAALLLSGSLVLLLSCAAAKGQGCAVTLSPHFSVYNSVVRDGTNIYTAVTMQGYSTVFPGPGCPMNTATHHVGAENKLNGVDHWSYSGSGCPTCYFSITDNEQIVGVPGIIYPWVFDGLAICTVAGGFWGHGGSGSIPGCLVPSTETTQIDATFDQTISRFDQRISDTAGDSFDGWPVTEGNAAPAQDTCWFQGSLVPVQLE